MEDTADGRLIYLAEQLVTLHGSVSVPWLTSRFEFLAERAVGASLAFLAVPDEEGIYRASRTASARPAVMRRLWAEMQVDYLSQNERLTAMIEKTRVSGEPVVLPTEEAFPGHHAMLDCGAVMVVPGAFQGEHMLATVMVVDVREDTHELAKILTDHTAVAMRCIRDHEEARRLHAVDPRLMLPDERATLVELQREVSRTRRYEREVGLARVEVVNERIYADTLGAFFTDELLRRIGRLVATTVRDTDFVGVLSGGFAIIHVETGAEGTRISAARLCETISRMTRQRFPEAPEPVLRASVSAFPECADSPEEMVRQVTEGTPLGVAA